MAAAVLRWTGRMLATSGAMWLPVDLPGDPAAERTLSQPPPGHPEQFCPDTPLSPVEQDLARRLSNSKESA
ncbi:hypothetical protein C3486_02990 [Streptomyces sp. Ru73]|nr:hypothetical protein C3486_02990 [Streptomyces sp. Ru73]